MIEILEGDSYRKQKCKSIIFVRFDVKRQFKHPRESLLKKSQNK